MSTLKIKVLSDLHLEFTDTEIQKDDCDFLVICGDLCEVRNTTVFTQFMERVCSIFDKVLYVPGNHEYYNSSIEDIDRYLENLNIPNFVYMNEKIYEYKNVVFIGAVLWSNITNNKSYIEWALNDYKSIENFCVEKSNSIHQRHVNFIESNLDAFKDKVKVVITHHTPLLKGTSHPRYEGSVINAAFSTDLGHLVEKADYWFCGHTHYCNDFMYGNCNVIMNCKGYDENAEFDCSKTVTL